MRLAVDFDDEMMYKLYFNRKAWARTHTCENINILIHTFAHSIQTDPHQRIRFLHIMICKWISVSWTKSCYHWKEINKNIKRTEILTHARTRTFYSANVQIIWVLEKCVCGRRTVGIFNVMPVNWVEFGKCVCNCKLGRIETLWKEVDLPA